MNWEDNEESSLNNDYNEDDHQRREEEMKRRDKKARKHPLLRQAVEIANITAALVESIEDDKERQLYEATLLESSMILSAKISGVINSASWLLSMQSAAIARYHAEYLLTATSGLNMLRSIDKTYVALLRDEMLLFRELFFDWCSHLRNMKEDGYTDEWGLFLR
jgi:hypothetical protein